MLIKCPECNGQISDKAKACPHCGFPVGDIDLESQISEGDESSEDQEKPVAEDVIEEPREEFTAADNHEAGSEGIQNAVSEASQDDDGTIFLRHFLGVIAMLAWPVVAFILLMVIQAWILPKFIKDAYLRHFVGVALCPIYLVWPIKAIARKAFSLRTTKIIGNVLFCLCGLFVVIYTLGGAISYKPVNEFTAIVVPLIVFIVGVILARK